MPSPTPLTLAILATVVLAQASFALQVRSEVRRLDFPLYKQCDSLWGNDEMGVRGNGERNTICNEGCAMTSTAMALAGLGATIDEQPVNPGTFNSWLKKHGGYLCLGGDCNNLNLTAPERLSVRMSLIGEFEKPSFDVIEQEIAFQRIVYVAHVRNKTHFVLLIGSDRSTRSFHVHDPFFNVTAYPYDNISDIIQFKINDYPLYKQCNGSWGSNPMGHDNETICQVGCLMSSISMAIAGTGIEIGNVSSDPETLNTWLRANGGYWEGTSDLIEAKVVNVNPHRIQWNSTRDFHLSNDVSFKNITALIDARLPTIVIANVMHGDHFVLVVGYRDDGDTLVVNDPGFNRNTYSYANDVVGWRFFQMR